MSALPSTRRLPIPLDTTTTNADRDTTTNKSQHLLQTRFNDWGHISSPSQLDAIQDLLRAAERAANRTLPPAVYLSPMPAGTGKTQSIIAFAETLLDDPSRDHVGILIACNRVAEVEDIAASLQAHHDRLCVIVGAKNTSVLALGGHKAADEAQVVICTQASLRETLRACPDFALAQRFHYRGQRRDVVFWDEAVAFNRPIILDGDQIGGLGAAMRKQSAEAATALKTWDVDLDKSGTGRVDVPDFEALGIDFHLLEQDASGDDNLASNARALGIISGGTVWAVQDNTKRSTVITHIPELPLSLLPMIVTDASASEGVNDALYRQMTEAGRPIVMLKGAAKTYNNLTLRLVPIAASRSAYRDGDKARALVALAVSYLRSVGSHRVLIIGYRGNMKGLGWKTIEASIRELLTPEEADRLSYIWWGKHTSTNDYRDIQYVLMLGLNFQAPAVAHATSGAALDKALLTADPADQPSPHNIEEVRMGMLRDATFQGALRGHARQGDNGDCGVMELVIPQGQNSGIPVEGYRGMFPGVNIIEGDTTLLPKKDMGGQLAVLRGWVETALQSGETVVSFSSLRDQMGIFPSVLTRLMRKPEWAEWMLENGLEEVSMGGKAKGIRRTKVS